MSEGYGCCVACGGGLGGIFILFLWRSDYKTIKYNEFLEGRSLVLVIMYIYKTVMTQKMIWEIDNFPFKGT